MSASHLPLPYEPANEVRAVREQNVLALVRAYTPARHVAANALLFAFPMALFVAAFGALRASDLPLLLGGVFMWGVAEHTLHRYILHGRQWPFAAIGREHVDDHHGYFTARHMYVEHAIDLNRVFLRPKDIAMIELIAGLIGLGVSQVFAPRTGALVALSSVAFYVIYELVHAAAHVRALSSAPGLRRITAHHRRHHVPLPATASNFATTLPFVDVLLGTKSTQSHDELDV